MLTADIVVAECLELIYFYVTIKLLIEKPWQVFFVDASESLNFKALSVLIFMMRFTYDLISFH